MQAFFNSYESVKAVCNVSNKSTLNVLNISQCASATVGLIFFYNKNSRTFLTVNFKTNIFLTIKRT